jgi:hypothetical protein
MAGLSPSTGLFGGSFLRSETASVATLQLNRLLPHDSIRADILLAAIDWLYGQVALPSADCFRSSIEGCVLYLEFYANALPCQIHLSSSLMEFSSSDSNSWDPGKPPAFEQATPVRQEVLRSPATSTTRNRILRWTA